MKLLLPFSTLFLLFLFQIMSFSGFGQNFNRPVPENIFPYEYVQLDTAYDFYLGVNLFHIAPGTENNRGKSILIDPDGYIAWYQEITNNQATMYNNFQYDEDNSTFRVFGRFSNSSGGIGYSLDTLFQFSNDSIQPLNIGTDFHEFDLSIDGTRILTTYHFDTMDLSAFTFNGIAGSSNTIVKCGGFQEFDTSGNVIFEWNSCENIHPSEAYGFSYNVNSFDYFHINSVDIDDDGHFLVSGRHTNSVIKVHRTTGEIIWRLGGISSDFSFVNDSGFSGQHDARSLDNGIISIHDNGNLNVPKKTRGLQYQLDTTNWTATLINSFDPSPSIYGKAMGSYRVIDSFDVISYGRIYRPEPSIIGRNALSNQEIFRMYFQDSVMTYRGIPFNLNFDLPRPEITCIDSNGIVYLTTSNNSDCIWSSGETTSSIIPVVGTEYQVYLPYGEGRIGSMPFTYDGICQNYADLDALTNNSIKKIVMTIDLLGREVIHRKKNTVYIEVYEDGSSTMIFE